MTPRRRVALVLNPHAAAVGPVRAVLEAALRSRAELAAEIETRGDGADVARIVAAIESGGIDVLVAAGGDGTVNDAAAALIAAREPGPALAILPLGTGNNVARSFGLESVRQPASPAMELALRSATEAEPRAIDAGEANGRIFVGSFCLGMDADILVLRNRWRQRLSTASGGYALYLASCAANVFRPHGGEARLVVDGVEERRRIYNLGVINAPLYAGEFRFDAGNDADDGQLDLHLVAGATEYLTEYPRAWRRHLRFSRGETVQPSPILRKVRELEIELDRATPAQIDGEQVAPAAAFRIRVLPDALRICRAAGGRGSGAGGR